jgi:hypothetical protein
MLTFLAPLTGTKLKIFPGQNDIELLILKVHQTSEPLKIATMHLATPLWRLHCFHITVSAVTTVSTPES